MTRLEFTITLVSDAEPGSGFGSESVDALVPRDSQGRPYITASHLKGLLRERLEDIGQAVGWPGDVTSAILGEEGRDGGDGQASAVFLSDACLADSTAGLLAVSRTAVGDLGTVAATSLRVTEAIAAGTRFIGTATVDAAEGDAIDLAARLGLLAIASIGASRTRGAGACQVTIAGETRTPGELLAELDPTARDGLARGNGLPGAGVAPRALGDDEAALLRMVWRARGAVCCPETPVVGNNVIRSGFVVPASAVQGAVLGWLSRVDEALANACFADARFRTWPLSPAAPVGDDGVPDAVRVSLTHRMSKLASERGEHEFRDPSIEPYDWREVAAGSPLKASDGVLLAARDGDVTLWRSADMPRLVTAHGVHADRSGDRRRNLFTVESMAPLAFSGWMALPREAAEALQADLAAHPETTLALGKARSIRGGGRIELERVEWSAIVEPSRSDDWAHRVFVVQSPVAIPDDWQVDDAADVLARLVESSDWGRPTEVSAHVGVRFGWNRHGHGNRAAGSRRLRAHRVVLPGSVFVLDARATGDAARGRLLRGIGEERQQGFGAVLAHPGIATRRHLPRPDVERIGSRDQAGSRGLKLWRQAGAAGPSASQVAALAARVADDPARAEAYLDRQVRKRPERTYRVWKDVVDDVVVLVREDPDLALRSLRLWQDLVVANSMDQEGRR